MRKCLRIAAVNLLLLFPVSINGEEKQPDSTCEYSNGILICSEQQKKEKLKNDENAKQVEEDEKNGLQDDEDKKKVKIGSGDVKKKVDDVQQIKQDYECIKVREIISNGESTYYIRISDSLQSETKQPEKEESDILIISNLHYSIWELLPDIILTQAVMNTLLWILFSLLSVFVFVLLWLLHKRLNIRK